MAPLHLLGKKAVYQFTTKVVLRPALVKLLARNTNREGRNEGCLVPPAWDPLTTQSALLETLYRTGNGR